MKTYREGYTWLPHLVILLVAFACKSKPKHVLQSAPIPVPVNNHALTGTKPFSVDAGKIMAMPQVPILCYHQIRDWKDSDSKRARDYIVPVSVFREQMRILKDSGYTTILPDQLYEYYTSGKQLPVKSVMLTFDDSDLDQYTVAMPEMDRYGFKAVFFVMTVSLGKKNYLSRDQVKDLAKRGHIIGSHTWDHKNVKQYTPDDWLTQVDKTARDLRELTGQPVNYFAFPFGLWKPESLPELEKRGFRAAFQLTAPRDERLPLYTIRRMIVPGQWGGATMLKVMKRTFPRQS